MTGARRRGHGRERCAACGLHVPLCICSMLPRLETTTRVVVLMHRRELHRTSNTGRLALACLANSGLVVRGETADEAAAGTAAAGIGRAGDERLVLFPAAAAEPLDRWHARPHGPVTLIVPDGTWGQARRMQKRVPGVASCPCVSLPPGAASGYRLRAAVAPERVSTIESIARALGILEGEWARVALDRVFTLMVERTLWMRGSIGREEVTGGIPEGVERHTG